MNVNVKSDNSRKSFPPGQIQLDRFPEGNQAFDILKKYSIFLWIPPYIICDIKYILVFDQVSTSTSGLSRAEPSLLTSWWVINYIAIC